VPELKGCLHVYESVYDSPYDFMHDLHAGQIGIQFYISHSLQWSVYTFQQKKQFKKSLARYHWQQIVHRIVWRFVRKIARVDGPLLRTQSPLLSLSCSLFKLFFFLIYVYFIIYSFTLYKTVMYNYYTV
jgi:hypothetical protein